MTLRFMMRVHTIRRGEAVEVALNVVLEAGLRNSPKQERACAPVCLVDMVRVWVGELEEAQGTVVVQGAVHVPQPAIVNQRQNRFLADELVYIYSTQQIV